LICYQLLNELFVGPQLPQATRTLPEQPEN